MPGDEGKIRFYPLIRYPSAASLPYLVPPPSSSVSKRSSRRMLSGRPQPEPT
jgi:hypothetical protein